MTKNQMEITNGANIAFTILARTFCSKIGPSISMSVRICGCVYVCRNNSKTGTLYTHTHASTRIGNAQAVYVNCDDFSRVENVADCLVILLEAELLSILNFRMYAYPCVSATRHLITRTLVPHQTR